MTVLANIREAEDQPEGRPRLALAGGSNRRPPDDDRRGQVIPFPRERVRPAENERDAGDADPMWPAWMAHVLTRYRSPEGGGHGPTGVFI